MKFSNIIYCLSMVNVAICLTLQTIYMEFQCIINGISAQKYMEFPSQVHRISAQKYMEFPSQVHRISVHTYVEFSVQKTSNFHVHISASILTPRYLCPVAFPAQSQLQCSISAIWVILLPPFRLWNSSSILATRSSTS